MFEAISDRAVRVSGSEFLRDPEYTIKLEGVRREIGMFFIPNYDAVVAPIAGLGASKYPPTTVAGYRTSRFASTASEAAAK